MRILWVKAGKLLPVDTGGKIRSYNILRHLARAHPVTVLTYYGGKKDTDYEDSIRREFLNGEAVYTAAPADTPLAQSLDYFRRIFQPAPFSVSKFTHPLTRQLIALRLLEKSFDVAVCDFLSASQNFPENPAAPVVLFQHNVETALWQGLAGVESNPVMRAAYWLEARKMANYERAALRKFRHVIAVSEPDRQRMLAIHPYCEISVVPTGVDTEQYRVAPASACDPPRILFLGSMDWEPNIDAVLYFCRDIFPRILARFPSAIFQIVGRNPHPSVRRLSSHSVQVTSTVPSVIEYLRNAALVVVPLRIGGGTRLKIFEAMATGRAVVSTSIGAEGLAVESGRDLMIADDAEAFAEAVVHLLGDSTVRRQYEQSAARLAAQYDWSNVAQQFAEVLQQVCRNQASPARPRI